MFAKTRSRAKTSSIPTKKKTLLLYVFLLYSRKQGDDNDESFSFILLEYSPKSQQKKK